MKKLIELSRKICCFILLSCIISTNLFSEEMVNAASQKRELKYNVTSFEDEMKLVYPDFKIVRKKQRKNYYYFAYYTPKYQKKQKRVRLTTSKMTFSSFAKKFGFDTCDCYTSTYTVKGNRDAKIFLAGGLSAYVTREIPFAGNYLIGYINGKLVDKAILPAGKYRKIISRAEIKYPEYKGSKTYCYKSFVTVLTIEKYDQKKKRWKTYRTIRGGTNPFYENKHWTPYMKHH